MICPPCKNYSHNFQHAQGPYSGSGGSCEGTLQRTRFPILAVLASLLLRFWHASIVTAQAASQKTSTIDHIEPKRQKHQPCTIPTHSLKPRYPAHVTMSDETGILQQHKDGERLN